MKPYKPKHLLLWAMIIAPVLALVLAIGADYSEHNWFLGGWGNSQLTEVTADIHTNGITAKLNDLLGTVPIPRGWRAIYVTEDQFPDGMGHYPDPVILAANPPSLVGQPERQLMVNVVGARIWRSAQLITAPDGKVYGIYLYRVAGNLPDVLNGAAVITAALAWLAMALWLNLDVRERRTTTAVGWMLLGLLTGPVALAVWLITRPTAKPFPTPTVCPGCGAETVPDKSFCVRCGHPLRPICPDCHSPVEQDWSHCGTCGAPLSE